MSQKTPSAKTLDTSESMAVRRIRLLNAILPVVALVLFIGIWEVTLRVFKVSPFLLPSPASVATAAMKNWSAVLFATKNTFLEVLAGFALSVFGGATLAILFTQAKWIRLSLYPYAIFLKTLPIIAIAPVIVLWLGYGFWGVVAISFIVGFLPILTSLTDGILSVPKNLSDLLDTYRASRWARLWKLQLPYAIPSFFSGCKVAIVSCVLGAVVGEFFAGQGDNTGLGVAIFANRDTNVALMFVNIIAAGLLGVICFALVSLAGELATIRWRDVSKS